jgi:serine/threonine protein kinase
MRLKREAISFMEGKNIIDEGESSTVLLAKYERIPVAVKQFEMGTNVAKVLKELQLLLKLGPHECLPMLIGAVLDKEPFLIVFKFYGIKGKISTNLSICLLSIPREKLKSAKWIPVIIKIAKGIGYFHDNGFLHGNIDGSHILIYKDDGSFQPKFVGLGSCQVLDIDDMDGKQHISREILSLGHVLAKIYENLSNKHPSTSYMLGRTLNELPHKRPSANEIENRFQEILDSGHFN